MGMVDHAEDLALARRLLAGDRRAFDGFFADFFPRLYRFVLLRVGGDADAAQDVCQQVFSRGLSRLESYRGEAGLFTWLCQIARREVADQWAAWSRDRARHLSYDQDTYLRGVLESLESDPLASPEAVQQRSELVGVIQAVLDLLPSRYGDVLEWKYVDGLDVAEIAARLNTTGVAAQSLLARARNAFRGAFAELNQELR
jgi:RNA polymerase sigma-70 factor (ECF subfamily)